MIEGSLKSHTPLALTDVAIYSEVESTAPSGCRMSATFRPSRVLVGILALLLGGSLLAGCGGDSVDACADGIRETVVLENAEMAAERKLDAAVEDDASPEEIDDLRQRYQEASGEASRRRRLTSTACDMEGGSGRDRPGSEAACSAAVEVWAEAADGLDEAQAEWSSAVRGWSESPGDVSAARDNLDGDEPSDRLADAFEALVEAAHSLDIARGTSGSTWAWAACGDSGQIEACAEAIDLLDEWGRKSREASEAADARVASYTTPEDDTADVLSELVRWADELAEQAC